jgi:c(7)-type cytochrome triheme protein
MSGFRYDFRLQGPSEVFDAFFPHSAHVEWLACETCHPRIFPYRGEAITMESVNNGETCGVCHGPVAFPPAACFRCHTGMPPSGQVEATLGDNIVLARSAEAATAASPEDLAVYPPASFSHWVHRIRYRCSACHPAPFETEVGADTLRMAAIERGAACGACHDGATAFGFLECGRCHVPRTEGGLGEP